MKGSKKEDINKKARKRRKAIIIIVALVFVLATGIYVMIANYRMSLIPSMTFEEMLGYTTKNNKNALITVGIIKDGKANFTVYGENARILPNKEYTYEIGSVTKTFTTSLLCKSIYEGKADLSDPIDHYIELPSQDYYPDLRRLVTHTSGYKSHYFEWQMASNILGGEKNVFCGISTKKLNQKISRISLEDKDYSFKYSNFGLSVVGSVLAEIYDKDYSTLMNDFISSELKLEHTSMSNGSGDMQGYWGWKADDGYAPAGAIVSTIGDMMAYVKIHMMQEKPYLSLGHEAIAQVNATSKQYEQMGIRIDAAGIGWMIDTENNIVWHNGGTSNFNSYVGFNKERQVGVVILANMAPNYRIPATVMGPKLMIAMLHEGP